jgi:glycosyltransferase involved in cell wall biosynthesis
VTPTISAVIAAYNAESWIGESLDAILGQTRPPDEIIVVNDGSTDKTARELERYAGRIEVVHQSNAGCPAAFNRAIAEATCDYVALCGSDDVWMANKLEWQAEAIVEQPDIDVLFGDAQLFGLSDERYARPPGEGRLDGAALLDALYRVNLICAPSVMIRRSLFERLGPFVEDFGADDYEYWLRCLRDGAVFFYDARVLLGYRRHESNLSSKLLWMSQCCHDVHVWYADLVADRDLVRDTLASDLFKIARGLIDDDKPADARRAFRRSARQRPSPRTLAWLAVLALPRPARQRSSAALIRLSRSLDAASVAHAT